MKYWIYDGQNHTGPLALIDVVTGICNRQWSPLSLISESPNGPWRPFWQVSQIEADLLSRLPQLPGVASSEAPEFSGSHRAALPNAPAHASSQSPSLSAAVSTEWYVLKGDKKFGPFPYDEVLRMLQEKLVFEFDFLWHRGLSSWQRLATFSEFKPNVVQAHFSKQSADSASVFFRRRHRRVKFNGKCWVHNNQAVWPGWIEELSSGGAGLLMANAMVIPGHNLYLHINPTQGLPPFNAFCEVVSKQYVKDLKSENAMVRYGLKFKSLSAMSKKNLEDYSVRLQAEAA